MNFGGHGYLIGLVPQVGPSSGITWGVKNEPLRGGCVSSPEARARGGRFHRDRKPRTGPPPYANAAPITSSNPQASTA